MSNLGTQLKRGRWARAGVMLLVLSAAVVGGTPGVVHSQSGVSYELDGFENGLRVVQPNRNDPNKYLWNLYESYASGATDVADGGLVGAKALVNRHDSGDRWQFQFYPYTEGLSGWGNGWQLARRFVTNPGSWATNRVNRLRFWIKLPNGVDTWGGGNSSLQFGSYYRCSGCSGAEDGGGHFYHMFNLGSTGEWHQVIVDTHPNHSRGDDGNREPGDRLHPTGESGFTYFDLMTRFYLDFPSRSWPLGSNFMIDGFEFYEETRPENVNQVFSLNGVYVPSSNKISVGWQRRKDEMGAHEVRYSFSDVFSVGWNAATPAPGGTVSPLGDGGYNGMAWSTTGISTSGRNVIYVAIKPQNSSSFRQIAIPLSGGGGTTSLPGRPTNLRIIPG
jgi:hypothetical protein